jgi:hypothetical protein
MSDNTASALGNPIDAVILWVDGSDPKLAEKRNHHLALEKKTDVHPGALVLMGKWLFPPYKRIAGVNLKVLINKHVRNKKDNFFAENAELLEQTISCRFRDSKQIIAPAIAYHLEILNLQPNT